MPFDGMACRAASIEIANEFLGKRVQRIYQPYKNEIHIYFSSKPFLLISAAPDSARAVVSQEQSEYPLSAPSFSMALRKHLIGASLASVEQIEFDRIIKLKFEALSASLGLSEYDMYSEIMGKHSNIILANSQTHMIVEAIKRVSSRMSSVREVLPGKPYMLPPQEKLDPLSFDNSDAINRLSVFSPQGIDKAISETFMGVSKQLAKTIVSRVGDDILNIVAEIKKIMSSGFEPSLYSDGKHLRDFSAAAYDSEYLRTPAKSISEAAEAFYNEKKIYSQLPQTHQNEAKRIKRLLEKAQGKLANRIEELEKAENSDEYQKNANLLLATPDSSLKGLKSIIVPNLYSNEMEPIEISLNESLSVADNAKRYFKLYRKAKNAADCLKGLIEDAENEYYWLSSSFYYLTTATSEAYAQETIVDLEVKGYDLGRQRKTSKSHPKAKLGPFRYKSADGTEIIVGRNDRQNDQITFKEAVSDDIWLHTKEIAGSHVIIKANGSPISDEALIEAAQIAAWHSSARSSSNVPVDYTKAKNVKKPSGAPAGKVIYTSQKTVYVDPITPDDMNLAPPKPRGD